MTFLLILQPFNRWWHKTGSNEEGLKLRNISSCVMAQPNVVLLCPSTFGLSKSHVIFNYKQVLSCFGASDGPGWMPLSLSKYERYLLELPLGKIVGIQITKSMLRCNEGWDAFSQLRNLHKYYWWDIPCRCWHVSAGDSLYYQKNVQTAPLLVIIPLVCFPFHISACSGTLCMQCTIAVQKPQGVGIVIIIESKFRRECTGWYRQPYPKFAILYFEWPSSVVFHFICWELCWGFCLEQPQLGCQIETELCWAFENDQCYSFNCGGFL